MKTDEELWGLFNQPVDQLRLQEIYAALTDEEEGRLVELVGQVLAEPGCGGVLGDLPDDDLPDEEKRRRQKIDELLRQKIDEIREKP